MLYYDQACVTNIWADLAGPGEGLLHLQTVDVEHYASKENKITLLGEKTLCVDTHAV